MELVSEIIEKISEESLSHSGDVSDAIRVSMTEILREMMADNRDIIGATVSSIDGLAWADVLAEGFDKHRFAAMSSSMLAIADELSGEMNRGSSQNLIIESDAGKILVMHAGPILLLTIFTKGSGTLGMAMAHAKQAADRIASMRL